MTKPNFGTVFTLWICLSCFGMSAQAQEPHSVESVKAAYVYNFLKYIRWSNEHNFETLRIGFIGNDTKFLEQCLLIQDRTIRKKNLVVHHVRNIRDINHYNVIITSKDQNKDLPNIARALYGKHALLISDDAKDKQLTMINFTYTDDERVGFEVNRHNMLYEKLDLSSDILLLGGTELDIANLLRDMEQDLHISQSQLRDQSEKFEQVQNQVKQKEALLKKQSSELSALQKSVSDKEQKILEQNQQIQKQTGELENQQKQLLETRSSLDKLKHELSELDQQLSSSRNQLETNTSLLSLKQQEIKAKETSINDLSKLINQNKQLLADQQNRIKNQALSIAEKEQSLASQTEALESQLSTIRVQSNILTLAGTALAIIFIFALLIYRNSRAKQRANAKLAKANLELERANTQLQETQGQLVESEKMAALGSLVAGVAHEINTPLGVSVTAISHLSESINTFNQQYQSGSLKRSELEHMLEDATESSAILIRNLNRASELIGNFKQVAADQTTEDKREFELRNYLEEVCQSLKPQLKQAGHKIQIQCPEINMTTFPGALAQIITNLVMNSMIHGFENSRNGVIFIVAEQNNNMLSLRYSDNGRGITDEQRDRIFDPFYTTKRAEGGTGLGMHICYNLVTQKLQGSISCLKAEQGALFHIEIPIHMNN